MLDFPDVHLSSRAAKNHLPILNCVLSATMTLCISAPGIFGDSILDWLLNADTSCASHLFGSSYLKQFMAGDRLGHMIRLLYSLTPE